MDTRTRFLKKSSLNSSRGLKGRMWEWRLKQSPNLSLFGYHALNSNPLLAHSTHSLSLREVTRLRIWGRCSTKTKQPTNYKLGFLKGNLRLDLNYSKTRESLKRIRKLGLAYKSCPDFTTRFNNILTKLNWRWLEQRLLISD